MSAHLRLARFGQAGPLFPTENQQPDTEDGQASASRAQQKDMPMDELDKLRQVGTLVYLNVEGNDAEVTYYFPRVPSIGEHVRILNSDGKKRHGLDETICVVTNVTYFVLEGLHKSSIVTDETHGWVSNVQVSVKPVDHRKKR